VNPGQLILVPNTLDLGSTGAPPIEQVLAHGVIEQAARLQHWVAENAKTTRAFLKRVDAQVPLGMPLQAIDIRELPRPLKGHATGAAVDLRPGLAPALQGHAIGLISEAGLPAGADPGAALVEVAHSLGVPVRPLAGPSSLLLALAASGLHGQSFAFIGYLPVDASARSARLRELEARSMRERQTQIAIETPYRNAALFGALAETLRPDTRLSVSCGLTLATGWTRSDPIARWRERPARFEAHLPAVFLWLAA
jgi:16S rRNA (cytidine1402-2'-O)-methyltransferase